MCGFLKCTFSAAGCAFVWQIFVYMCGRPWHSLSNAHPMCIVYRMLIDLLSGVYFTVFTVKWFHQYKPQLELRQSENKHRIKAHKLREWPIIHRQGVNFQSCGHYWFPEVRLPKLGSVFLILCQKQATQGQILRFKLTKNQN